MNTPLKHTMIIAFMSIFFADACGANEIAKGYNCKIGNKPDAIVKAFIQGGVVTAKAFNNSDSILSFEAHPGFTAFGFPLIAVAGWDQNSQLFGRGPGTAPPVHFAMIVQAASWQLRGALAKSGLKLNNGKPNEPFPQIQVESYNSAEPDPLPKSASQGLAYSQVTCTIEI